MNTNMRVTIRHLTNAFVLLLLVLSAAAAYVQIGNSAPFSGPQLVGGGFETQSRLCPRIDKPLRGTIYDDKGNWIAKTMSDNGTESYICGYHRVYAQWAIDTGLSTLIGYATYSRGSSGIEASYDAQLSGNQFGQALYLTIDKNVQEAANKYYESSVETGSPGGSCPTTSNQSGSITVEDPKTGAILAMVSKPNYDPNKIVDSDSLTSSVRAQADQYWAGVQNAKPSVLLNRAAQGLYAPGSTFKTVTLAAALDTGKYALTDTGTTGFTQDQAMSYTVSGHTFNWDDVSAFQAVAKFPMSLQDGYAYSDNVIYARLGVDLGFDTWVHYVGQFGIETPGKNWNQNVGFDSVYAQSSAYPQFSTGGQSGLSDVDLAASAFGQGQLLISPLTMAVVSSTIANNGVLARPHAGLALAAHGGTAASGAQVRDPSTDTQVVQPGTAQNMRAAMWAVSSYGTGGYGNGPDPNFGSKLTTSGVFEGGKTGTAQASGQPGAWWISLAPDDQAPGAPGGARYVIVVNKEGNPATPNQLNEGACQVYVADDIYRTLLCIQ